MATWQMYNVEKLSNNNIGTIVCACFVCIYMYIYIYIYTYLAIILLLIQVSNYTCIIMLDDGGEWSIKTSHECATAEDHKHAIV